MRKSVLHNYWTALRGPAQLAALLLLVACTQKGSDLDIPGLTVLEEGIKPAAFRLQDQHGKPFEQNRLAGKWDIAFFGYTHCPDVCPTSMAILTAVNKHLQEEPALRDTRFVFFSVDPYRDTVPVLKGYMDYFNKDFSGVTGDGAVVHELASTVGVFYDYETVDGRELHRDVARPPPFKDYLVNHSAGIYFFNPHGELAAYQIPPFSAEKILEVYRKLRSLN